MRWGVAITTYKPKWIDQKTTLENSIEYVKSAESLGFEDAWVFEHHYTEYGLCPDAMVMASYLLGATTTIKIGTAVIVAPLYHPVRLIENIALLDQMSDGRFLPGFGRGFFPAEFKILGVVIEKNHELMQEAIEIVKAAWDQDGEISWDSELFQIPKIKTFPSLRSSEHPEMFVVGESPSTIEWAATQGIPIIMNIPQSYSSTNAKLELYNEICDMHGHDPAKIKHMIAAVVHVSNTREKAMDDILTNIENWHEDGMREAFSLEQMRELPNYRFHFSQWQDAVLKGESDASNVVRKALEISPVGTPEDCIAAFTELREQTGVEHYMCGFEGAMNFDKTMKSMERFAKEVIPKL